MSETAPTQLFYQAGGTLAADGASYVERPADAELMRLIQEGAFCYILTPRQTGKSSLMARTARRLRKQGTHVALIDLTSLGTEGVTIDRWYLGLLTRLKNGLLLSVDEQVWWQQRDSLSEVQRFTDFLCEIVLDQITGQVVIFLDEIDSTLKLDFRDDFFAAIRSIYNARSDNPAFSRLTFVLLGVAAPNDLISDPQRTPFNIGKAIDLKDFTLQDAQMLRGGLDRVYPDKSGVVFDRIFYWTGGHPYLTQMLCASMLEIPPEWWNADGVDDHIYKHMISGAPHSDINLQTVHDSITKSPQQGDLLSLYKKTYEGQRIPEDERSPEQNYLRLYGLVRAQDGLLQVRNAIYRHVFDDEWIKKNSPEEMRVPVNRPRWITAFSAVLVIAIVVTTILFATSKTDFGAWTQAQIVIAIFNMDQHPEPRLGNLARLFELPSQAGAARELFYSLNQTSKLALFSPSNPQASGPQLITVVNGLYSEVPHDPDGNELLHAMSTALSQVDDPAARLLNDEIKQWLEGRTSYDRGEYAQAVSAYTLAFSRFNSRNLGIYLDRALAFAQLSQPGPALDDLAAILTLNPSQAWKNRVKQALQTNPTLADAARSQKDKYPALAILAP